MRLLVSETSFTFTEPVNIVPVEPIILAEPSPAANKLVPVSGTLTEMGLLKLWDCGKKRWLLKLK